MVRIGIIAVVGLLISGAAAAAASAEPALVARAGEWVFTRGMDGGTMGMEQKICYPADRTMDDASFQKLMARGAPGMTCSFDHSKSGSVIAMNSTCSKGVMQIKTVALVTIVGADEYSVASTAHVENGPQGMPPEITMAMHWKRAGACQPGDRMSRMP